MQLYLGRGYFNGSDERRLAIRYELLSSLLETHGIEDAGTALILPLGAGSGSKGAIPVVLEDDPSEPRAVEFINWVSPDYFRTMGMRLLQGGRDFNVDDVRSRVPVAVVNESFAREFLGVGAVGKRMRMGGPGPRDTWITVIGVVNDIRQSLSTAQGPGVYFPDVGGVFGPPLNLVVRTNMDAAAVATVLREAVHRIDPDLPVSAVQTMESRASQSIVVPRFYAVLLGSFAGFALLLAAIGIYGTMSYTVGQRTREVGIRMALGADVSSVLGLVLRQGMLLTSLGIALGLAGALFASRVLESFLFGINGTDIPTFVAVSGVLLTVALLAAYVPARRAAKVDPVISLRAD